jgi:hypothetical protein
MSKSLGGQRTLTVLQHNHQTHHSSTGIKSKPNTMVMSIMVLLGLSCGGCVPGGGAVWYDRVVSRARVSGVDVSGVVVVVVLEVVVVGVIGEVSGVVVSSGGLEVSGAALLSGGTLCGREKSPCYHVQQEVLMVVAWGRPRSSIPRCPPLGIHLLAHSTFSQG